MPLYEFKCLDQDCGMVQERLFNLSDCPDFITCTNCLTQAKKIISSPNIHTGQHKARVFYQYAGNPETCPADVREALRYQDQPKGLPISAKEGKAVITRGDKQGGKELYR